MSAAAPTRSVAPLGGTSVMLRIAAVTVVIALAGLAAYAVFSGPTRVSVNSPSRIVPRTVAPPPVQREPEGEGGGGD